MLVQKEELRSLPRSCPIFLPYNRLDSYRHGSQKVSRELAKTPISDAS